MGILSRLFGPKDPEIRAKRLIEDLTYRSPTAATLAAEIDRFVQANPMLAALGSAFGGIGSGGARTSAALNSFKEKERRLEQEYEHECRIRAGAALKLGELRHPVAVEPLIAALKDEYRVVRSNAARALGSIGDKRAIESLTSLTQEDLEKDKGVREVALEALEAVKKSEKESPPSHPAQEITEHQKAAIEKLLEEYPKQGERPSGS